MFPKEEDVVQTADIVIIIGTSMQVYPAAALLDYVEENVPIYFIDPKPAIRPHNSTIIINEQATVGVPKLVLDLLQNS